MKNSHILHLHKIQILDSHTGNVGWGLAMYKQIKNIALGKISQLFN